MPAQPTVYDRVNPDGSQLVKMDKFRATIKMLDDFIRTECPPGRNQSLALTNLELVQVYFNKGVTHDEPRKDDNAPRADIAVSGS